MRFYNELLKTVPVLSYGHSILMNELITTGNFINQNIEEGSEFKIPYLEAADNFDMLYHDRNFILVSEDKNAAIKAAIYMMNLDRESESSDDELLFDYDDDEFLYENSEFERNNANVIVDFSKCAKEGNETKYYLVPSVLAPTNRVLFLGLSDGVDISKKLPFIRGCQSTFKMLWIRPSQKNEKWVLNLQAEDRMRLIELDKLPANYYASLIRYLLKKANAKLEKGLTPELLTKRMATQFGDDLNEEAVCFCLDEAVGYGCCEKTPVTLHACDFKSLSLGKKDALEALMKMTGLSNVKQMAEEYAALLQEGVRNPELGIMHNNMIFYGNPGTGKTTTASLLAEILTDFGNCSANFVTATRAELLGKYVGHTAPLIAEKFEEATGGILFVDEAGFFLNQNAGGYVDEAIKEFVRYMENKPDVTVIFAMYEHEVKEFLSLDEGLSSRISKMVFFSDYTDEELNDISRKMAFEKGYQLEESCTPHILHYCSRLRGKRNFGNAREMRKLIESAIISVSLRHMRQKKSKMDCIITESDITYAIERLKSESLRETKQFGFAGNIPAKPNSIATTSTCV